MAGLIVSHPCVSHLPVLDVSLIHRTELEFILSLTMECLPPGRQPFCTVVTDTCGLACPRHLPLVVVLQYTQPAPLFSSFSSHVEMTTFFMAPFSPLALGVTIPGSGSCWLPSHHLTPTPTRVHSPCSVGDTERHVQWTLERAPLSGWAGTSVFVGSGQ